MKIGINGINGKMGRAIAHELTLYPNLKLSAASVREGHPWRDNPLSKVSDLPYEEVKPTANLAHFVSMVDVVIDFTRPEATLALLPFCQKLSKPLLIGTTGFNDDGLKWIRKASHAIPIVLAANTSLGINVLFEITRRVAQALPLEHWDVDIFEAHHREKTDAPSGTALRLGQLISQAQETVFSERMRYPYTQKRKEGDIGFSVMRGGDVTGEHTIFFTKNSERIELTHRATDRRIFAEGAIKAAQWVSTQPPGLYNMEDVLGFNH